MQCFLSNLQFFIALLVFFLPMLFTWLPFLVYLHIVRCLDWAVFLRSLQSAVHNFNGL